MRNGMWTADRRVFLDAEGNAVDEKSPDRVELLVAPGHRIPMDRAIALGLVEEEAAAAKKPSKSDDSKLKAENESLKSALADRDKEIKDLKNQLADRDKESSDTDGQKSEPPADDKSEEPKADKSVKSSKNK